jgi:hypothetical protein
LSKTISKIFFKIKFAEWELKIDDTLYNENQKCTKHCIDPEKLLDFLPQLIENNTTERKETLNALLHVLKIILTVAIH